MPEARSADGRFWAVEQGDGNFVVYDLVSGSGKAVWDRWSYESETGEPPSPPTPPETPRPGTVPSLPDPDVPWPSGGLRVIQVTDASDGELIPRMYSYWSSAYIDGGTIIVFCGHLDNRPRLFRVGRATGQVQRLGWPFPYTGTTEGWYWDRQGWLYLCDGPRLRRVDPLSGDDSVVFDISDQHPGCRLWQAHSSDDGQTHSATVQRIVSDGPYPNIGTVVVWHGQQDYYPAHGTLDESQITADGAYLIIKEDDDNRVITMGTRETRLLHNEDGAVGHSDVGAGIVVGEDDIHGECVLWDLRGPLVPERRRTLFKTWGMGHVSLKGGRCLLSDATHLSLVALDGSGVTPLLGHGMVGSDYDHQVEGNLDPTGRVACYMSNMGGDRFDVFLAILP